MALVASVVMAGASVAAQAEGDAQAGEAVFKKCAACHGVEAGKDKVGPSLHGVVGRKAGGAESFKARYSAAMTGSGMTWDDATLDKYLADPKAAIPGNKMSFVGLKDEKERQDVIAYLKKQK
ncbi:MAG: cytochrome c family protein [Magnetococcales bacterium]|nr:cytochrome c family protein [Magnetococcales bacterium]